MIETSFKNWQTQDKISYNISVLFYIRDFHGPRVTTNIAKLLQQRKFPILQYYKVMTVSVHILHVIFTRSRTGTLETD